MKLESLILFASFFGVGTLAACGSFRGSQGQTSGLYDARVKLKSTQVATCWDSSAASYANVTEFLQKKLSDEFNGRTAVKLSFAKCSDAGVSSSAMRLIFNESGTGYCKGSPLAVTAWKPNALIEFCVPSLRKSYGAPLSTEASKGGWAFAALHEMGHALGLMHEHVREDMEKFDSKCRAKMDGSYTNWRNVFASERAGTTAVGAYDPDSVMNYCHSNFVGHGPAEKMILSLGDIATLAAIYGSSASESNPKDSDPKDSDPKVEEEGGAEGPETGIAESGAEESDSNGTETSESGAEESESTVTEGNSNTGQSKLQVYCAPVPLQKCILTWGGGSGCLNPSRSQKECSSSAGPGRVAVDFETVGQCMRTGSANAAKFACLGW
jgi:hypothetical protein